MNVSIYNQIRQLEKMHRILSEYADNLRYHVIVGPESMIDEALYYGLPEEIGSWYKYRYFAQNRTDAENIISYINCFCLPYLESQMVILKETLNVT